MTRKRSRIKRAAAVGAAVSRVKLIHVVSIREKRVHRKIVEVKINQNEDRKKLFVLLYTSYYGGVLFLVLDSVEEV